MKKLKEYIINYLTLMGICTLVIFIMYLIGFIIYRETTTYLKVSVVVCLIISTVLTISPKNK